MGNVPDDVTDIDLADYFTQIGEVLSAQIRGNDGGRYGFVEFAYPDDVHRVLAIAQEQPFEMGDQQLRVQPRRQKDLHQVSFFFLVFLPCIETAMNMHQAVSSELGETRG